MPEMLECQSCGLSPPDPQRAIGTRCPRCGAIILPPATIENRVQGAGSFYRSHQFPRWMGPVVGPVVGAVFGAIKGMNSACQAGLPLWYPVAAFAGIGLLAGCILVVIDRPTRRW